MKNILEYKRVLSVTGAAVLAVSGACWGYVYAHTELEADFNDRVEAVLNAEIEKTRKFYEIMYKREEPEDLSELHPDAVVDHHQIIIDKAAMLTPESRARVIAELALAFEPDEDEVIEEADTELEYEQPVEVNAFDAGIDDQTLLDERSPENPYIISEEEFARNDANFEVVDLTFFDTDGILIDETDVIIPDTDSVVGDRNLQRFGVWSKDNRVVHVQNDRTETIFRIRQNFTSYGAAVHGLDEEEGTLQHSMMRRRPSRRDD